MGSSTLPPGSPDPTGEIGVKPAAPGEGRSQQMAWQSQVLDVTTTVAGQGTRMAASGLLRWMKLDQELQDHCLGNSSDPAPPQDCWFRWSPKAQLRTLSAPPDSQWGHSCQGSWGTGKRLFTVALLGQLWRTNDPCLPASVPLRLPHPETPGFSGRFCPFSSLLWVRGGQWAGACLSPKDAGWFCSERHLPHPVRRVKTVPHAATAATGSTILHAEALLGPRPNQAS